MEVRIDSIIKKLDTAKRLSKNGGEYWMGRELQEILGYSSWENFQKVIKKARMACSSINVDENDHFHDTMKMIRKLEIILEAIYKKLIELDDDANK